MPSDILKTRYFVHQVRKNNAMAVLEYVKSKKKVDYNTIIDWMQYDPEAPCIKRETAIEITTGLIRLGRLEMNKDKVVTYHDNE